MKPAAPEEIPPRMWLLIAVFTFLFWAVVQVVTAARHAEGKIGHIGPIGPMGPISPASAPEDADPCDPARQRARITARDAAATAARLSTLPD